MRIIALVLVLSTSAIAGPPLDGPAPPPSAKPPEPPALLSTSTEARPRTWEERHVWEERGTLVGILGGAFVGAASCVGLVALATQPADPATASAGPAIAVAMGMVGLYGGALGAYAGGAVGAGIGVVIDAANAPGPDPAPAVPTAPAPPAMPPPLALATR